MTHTFNVNIKARVRLTLHGWALLETSCNGNTKHALVLAPGGVYEAPLWDIMNTFGPSMVMGIGQLPFVDNQIEIVDEPDWITVHVDRCRLIPEFTD